MSEDKNIASINETELMYNFAEPIFGAVAKDMWQLGWSIMPQKIDRTPGTVYNKSIKWQSEYDLSNKQVDEKTLSIWMQHCSTENVAVAMGKGSKNIFALDMDIMDRDAVEKIIDLADEILGYTPFRRVGREPKIALFYRYHTDDPITFDRRSFEKGEDDALEIQSSGRLMTFHGIHHKTTKYYRWLDKNPLFCSPEEAPEISSEKLAQFIDAVDRIHPFSRGAAFDYSVDTWKWDENTSKIIPRYKVAGGGIPWKENADGKVVDGREAFLTHLTHRIVMNDSYKIEEIKDNKQALIQFMEEKNKIICEEFKERCVIDKGEKWDRNLAGEAKMKINILMRKIFEGRIKIKKKSEISFNQDGIPLIVAPHNPDEELSFLPKSVFPGHSFTKRKPFRARISSEKINPNDVALQPDRTEIAHSVQEGLKKAYREFTDSVYNQGSVNPIHIVYAPTGAGKTSRTIFMLGDDPRTKEPVKVLNESGDYEEKMLPYVMLLPTYENIGELRHRAQNLNLNADLPDEELRLQAMELGLIHKDDLETNLEDLKRDAINAGLKTMIYKGKIAAGCKMKDKVEIAMTSGMGTSGFCKSFKIVPSEDKNQKAEIEEIFCEYYNECPAISQRSEIQNSHIVFVPHAFMSLSIPEELKDVRAVIADERIHHLFLHSTVFDLSSLEIPRKKPRLSKIEIKNGVTPDDLLIDRNAAASIAIEALKAKKCPALALLDYSHEVTREEIKRDGTRQKTTKIRYDGPLMVKNALRVCSAAIQKDTNLHPEMSLDEVQVLCSQPTGYQVREEFQFWKIIEERIQDLMHDRLILERMNKIETVLLENADEEEKEILNKELDKISSMLKCFGEKDYRIQYVIDDMNNGNKVERVRISWRTTPNWVDKPLMLLDASAAPDIISKIWSNRPVIKHDIPAALNMKVVGVVDKTFSNISMIGHHGMSNLERLNCGRTLNSVRKAITNISSLYGYGRVVIGTSMCLRKAINNGWVTPKNTDWTHYGAMRGLDFAKFHSAAISIGRMEVPVRSIDGLVAALTYDDIIPEEPFDKNGNGLDDNSKQLRLPNGLQKLKMRTGHIVELPTPMYPGKWARLIQKQYREEEILQFGGRLRPVYREGEAPVWYAFSSVIPENLIIDDLISLNDITQPEMDFWETARRTGGVITRSLIKEVSGDLFRTDRRIDTIYENLQRNPRNMKGYIGFTWGIGEQKESGFIQSGISDPEITIRAAIEYYLGYQDIDIKINGDLYNNKGRKRNPDKVDNAIGDLDKRKNMEETIRDDIAYEVLMKYDVEYNEMGGPNRIISTSKDGTEKYKIQYSDLDACRAIDLYWKQNQHNETISGDVISDNDENYEKMGNNIEYQEYSIGVNNF